MILEPADIETSTNGNAAYITTRLQHAGRWLQLSATTIHLAPRAERQVAYTVRIPAAVSGGSHYAGIVAIDAAELSHPAARDKGTSKGHGFVIYRISRQALPLTIRLPGRLSDGLSLRSVKLSVAPSGASLMLGLLPGGTELTESAQVNLRIVRGHRTIFTSDTELGQLFPGSPLSYRIAWPGAPTPGAYRVLGTIRPVGSAVITIDRTVKYTSAKASLLESETPPGPATHVPGSGVPGWVWIALCVAVALLIGLSLAVWKLTRRDRPAPAYAAESGR
jgi:hypothetical protein